MLGIKLIRQQPGGAEAARRQGAEQESRIAAARDLSDRLRVQEAVLRAVEEELGPLLRALPNLPHASVPVGRDPSANVTVRTWGAPTALGFPPRDHADIGGRPGLRDPGRGAPGAGARRHPLRA